MTDSTRRLQVAIARESRKNQRQPASLLFAFWLSAEPAGPSATGAGTAWWWSCVRTVESAEFELTSFVSQFLASGVQSLCKIYFFFLTWHGMASSKLKLKLKLNLKVRPSTGRLTEQPIGRVASV